MDDSQHELDFNIQIEDNTQPKNLASSQPIQNAQQMQVMQPTSPSAPQVEQNLPVIQGSLDLCAIGTMLFFKSLAILAYFFLNAIFPNKSFTFIVIVILNSFDFWVVKNICGRRLVGLRWWSEISEDGSEKWYYESPNTQFIAHDLNSSVFWISQVGCTIFWLLFMIMNLITFTFFWFLLDLISCSLSEINIVGFYRCRGEHQKKAKSLMLRFGLKAFEASI